MPQGCAGWLGGQPWRRPPWSPCAEERARGESGQREGRGVRGVGGRGERRVRGRGERANREEGSEQGNKRA